MSALLEVEDLRVQFATRGGEVTALDGISFALHAGKTLAVVGDSGAGKTVAALTTVGLARGRHTRISGRVAFAGSDLIEASEAELRSLRGKEIALIFGDLRSSLHPLYKVGRQVVDAIRAHRRVSKQAARDRAIDALELAGIADAHECVDSYPHELPDGVRARAAIAMAVANEPELLIADEPTRALDPSTRGEIMGLLGELQRRLDMAILITARDRDLIAAIADEIYALPSSSTYSDSAASS